MRCRIIVGGLAASLAFGAPAGAADPPDCPGGQAVSTKTIGHCCWPGQTWSLDKKACAGSPQCPAGFDLNGETCVAKAPVECPAGQSVSADTAGHCCWQNQAWSNSRQGCVGIPQCTSGFDVSGETCVPTPKQECKGGQSMTSDTAGHCCWAGQAWASTRQTCVGVPQCPSGLQPQGETCVEPPRGPPPPIAPPASAMPPSSGGATWAPSATPLPSWSPGSPAAAYPPAQVISFHSERRNRAMFITGWVSVGVGMATYLVGLPLVLTAKSSSQCPSNYLAESRCVNTARQTGGVAMMVAGGTLAVAGIVFVQVGGSKVSVPDKPASAIPGLRVGLGSASLDWTF